jgi:hypothetical protein
MMSNAPFFTMMRWNLRISLRWHSLAGIFVLFGFTGWRSAIQVVDQLSSLQSVMKANLWDAFFVSFSGPGVWGYSLVQALPWLISHILFFYLFGVIAIGELLYRGYAVVPLVGSRLRWWFGKEVALLIFAVGYVLMTVLAVLAGGSIILPWSWQPSELMISGEMWVMPKGMEIGTLLGWIFILFSSTLYALASVQLTLSLIGRRSFYGFSAIAVIAIISWLLGIDNPYLSRWLPGSQSMLLRHTFFDPNVPGFSMEWSLIYNITLFLIVLSVGAWYVRRMDIHGPTP